MKGKRIAATCVSGVLTLTLGLGMVGCGSNNQAAQSSASSQQSQNTEKAAELQVLGTQKDGAQELKVKNGLGSALTAFSLRVSGEQAYQSNLVASGKKVAADEEVRLFVDGVKPEATYDIRVTKDGGGDVEFLAIPVSKIASLTLKEADSKAYVDYVGTDKTNGSTKDAAAVAGAAAAAGTAAAAGAAAAAGTDGSGQAAASQDNSAGSAQQQESSSDDGNVPEEYYAVDGYDDSANAGGGDSGASSSEAPAPVAEAPAAYEEPAAPAPAPEPAPAPAPAPSAPAQTEDVCVPDVVLR